MKAITLIKVDVLKSVVMQRIKVHFNVTQSAIV